MTRTPTSPPQQQPQPQSQDYPQEPSARPPRSIALQDLPRSPDELNAGQSYSWNAQEEENFGGTGQPFFGAQFQGGNMSYETAEPTAAQMASSMPGIDTYWGGNQGGHLDEEPDSPIDHMALQFALPPDIRQGPSQSHASASNMPYDSAAPYYAESRDTDSVESDRVPLKPAAQAMGLGLPGGEEQGRSSFQTVSDMEPAPQRSRSTHMLGFNLRPELSDPEPGLGHARHQSYGHTLHPENRNRSRSPSTSGALSRAGSIMRAMSQRVVAISGEADLIDQQARRDRSPSVDGRRQTHLSGPMLVDTSYPSQVFQTPLEKRGEPEYVVPEEPPQATRRRGPLPNPLRGKSLGIFSPENPIRKRLCDLLVKPWTEPIILILIILQAILLAIEAAPDVFLDGNQRPERWGSTAIDWTLLGLFVVFTIELVARIIVSGFIVNAPEYTNVDLKKGVRERVAEQYRSIFQPQRQKSVRAPRPETFAPNTFARSFTIMQGQALPETVEEQQRLHLARRAFLRHGFNRLDFVAVVSFWISFVLGITGIESLHHIYVFRMMSCLRILRLLALTRGNAIILRSLKKAAPLLVRVSFLIFFFWLVFAIVGVQSFKSSFGRSCVWIDPDDPLNLTATWSDPLQLCGGYYDNTTNDVLPWQKFNSTPPSLSDLIKGSNSGKGFLCPRGSICLEQTNPFNGTVNFDDIGHSMELVFVIMSANTFSDLMYHMTDSDYLPAALYFAAGIVIMMLWMTNLLIAVITSSFQVIREENKASAFTADEQPLMQSTHDDGLKRMSSLQRIYQVTSWFWVLIIAFDLLSQAFRSASMDDSRARYIDTVSTVVTLVLDAEIIFRIVADFRGFHRKLHNLADLLLAVMTSIILIPPIHNSGQAYAWLSVFQILRVYRIVLAVPMTRKLIQLVLGNATGIGNLMLFVFLMTFLMAIFAAQLFRGEIPQQDDDGNRINISFNTMYNSFLGMYQVLSSENWTDILYNVTSYTTATRSAWIGSIFLIGWFTMSFFILINMFIAVIQENFDVGEDIKRLEQVRAFLQRKELGGASSNLALSKVFTLGKTRRRKDPLDYGPAMMEMLLKEAVVREFLDEAMDPLQDTGDDNQSTHQTVDAGLVKPGLLSSIWGKVSRVFSSRDPNPFYSGMRFDRPNETLDPREMARQAVTATSARRKAQREYLARHPAFNNSLFIFTPKNPIRHMCQLLVGPGRGSERFDGVEPNKYAWYIFSAVIYAAIVAMVALACVTTPLYQKEYFTEHTFSILNWFVWTDMAFAIVFSLEALIKIIADGFFWTPNAYFRSTWGIIDLIVLVTLWINVITLFTNDGAVSRAVGAFKALRALRLLNVSDSARETFHSLIILGGWKILSAAFVSISLLIPFAIYGLNLFAGKMVTCNDSSGVVQLLDCFGEYNSTPFSTNWPMLSPRAAENPFFSFDDFASSLLILFQIVSQEGWVDVSFAAQSITGVGLQPQDGNSQGNALFFVVFNLMATVFVLTLFISVFMRFYTEQTGVAFLTAEQRSWLELRKLLRQISPSKSSYDETKNKWKKWCHKRAIEKRGKWYVAVTIVLVLHLILLLSEFYQEPFWWTRTRDIIFLLFILLYIANIVIRIVGLGWSRFRRSSWDIYSMLAVTGAFATSILFLTNTTLDTYIQLHKFFLVAIVLLLIPRNDALDQLFKTAAASLTTIGNLLATWLVFFLVFAIALTQTFSLTRFGSQETNNLNLRTVPNALILLFRMSCGEGWNQIMEDYAQINPPLCVESDNFFDSDCGSLPWARVLFILWNIISMYLFVNLFVSLIFESFSYVYQRTSGLAVVDRDEIRRFKEAWRSVDPQGTGFITKEQFPRLLGELSGVFEMRVYEQDDSVRQILEDIRSDAASIRHASIASTSALHTGVDLKRLNERLAQIDVAKVRERRRRFNIFFEEVMVSADPDKGISFTTVLMILAHYNIINDSKSLRLEEFLRRRARLQRVEEEVRRRIVQGFFDMMYWSRQFKRHMDRKRSARMTAIPQLDVPEILVDNEEERAYQAARENAANEAHSPYDSNNSHNSYFASPAGTQAGGDFGYPSAISPQGETGYLSADTARHHSRHYSGASADISSFDTSYGHPLSFGQPSGGGLMSPGGGHRANPSAFSFEVHDGAGEHDGAGGQPGNSQRSSRRGSSVSPAQVREMLDDSVWMDTIRRSATIRRSEYR